MTRLRKRYLSKMSANTDIALQELIVETPARDRFAKPILERLCQGDLRPVPISMTVCPDCEEVAKPVVIFRLSSNQERPELRTRSQCLDMSLV